LPIAYLLHVMITQILGVLTDNDTQITIYDTPGINEASSARKLQRQLATEAWDTSAVADIGTLSSLPLIPYHTYLVRYHHFGFGNVMR
jgi:predicted transcriptional regulator